MLSRTIPPFWAVEFITQLGLAYHLVTAVIAFIANAETTNIGNAFFNLRRSLPLP
jgi:hypothetical protein